MKKFCLGLILGLISGIVLSVLWFTFGNTIFGQTYTVKSIESHYPQGDNNSQTTIIVYLKGKSGHTKEILCAFPPDVILEGNNETGWSGLEKVRIGGVAEEFMFGKVSYYAEKIE